MITIKLDLARLKHTISKMKSASGEVVDCLVIPIGMNTLYKGEKGVYLDLIAFEKKEVKSDDKDTHLIKQSFSKEVREKMTEDEKNSLPILGNMRIWEAQESKTEVELTPADPEPTDLPF